MPYKFKYLIVREKPYNTGETVAQVDVSHLNKKGMKTKWDELDVIFSPDKYSGSLTECNQEMREFLNKPITVKTTK